MGALLIAVAAWVAYASTLPGNSRNTSRSRDRGVGPSLWVLCPSGAALGLLAGFLGIAGGFIVVPTLMVLGELDILEAAATAMLPIAVFAG